MAATTPSTTIAPAPVTLPRIAITFCTQCRWMLRAAYFAQELLSTFSLSIGEIALVPSTGGVFAVDLIHSSSTSTVKEGTTTTVTTQSTTRIWDRKEKGGFPETKVLKQLVRDIIQPDRGLGHSDVGGKKKEESSEVSLKGEKCEPCKETLPEKGDDWDVKATQKREIAVPNEDAQALEADTTAQEFGQGTAVDVGPESQKPDPFGAVQDTNHQGIGASLEQQFVQGSDLQSVSLPTAAPPAQQEMQLQEKAANLGSAFPTAAASDTGKSERQPPTAKPKNRDRAERRRRAEERKQGGFQAGNKNERRGSEGLNGVEVWPAGPGPAPTDWGTGLDLAPQQDWGTGPTLASQDWSTGSFHSATKPPNGNSSHPNRKHTTNDQISSQNEDNAQNETKEASESSSSYWVQTGGGTTPGPQTDRGPRSYKNGNGNSGRGGGGGAAGGGPGNGDRRSSVPNGNRHDASKSGSRSRRGGPRDGGGSWGQKGAGREDDRGRDGGGNGNRNGNYGGNGWFGENGHGNENGNGSFAGKNGKRGRGGKRGSSGLNGWGYGHGEGASKAAAGERSWGPTAGPNDAEETSAAGMNGVKVNGVRADGWGDW